jgi:hypothetical protein
LTSRGSSWNHWYTIPAGGVLESANPGPRSLQLFRALK